MGRLTPAGTGAVMNRLRQVAMNRDQARGVGSPSEPPALPAAE